MTRRHRWGYAMLIAVEICIQSGETQTLLQNGSFEQGEKSPVGWQVREGGTWMSGDTHRGQRHIRGEGKKGRVVWESDAVPLQPQTDYRIEGWVRCPSGEGRLSVDLLDAQRRVIGQAEAPAVRDAASWTYTAAEWGPGTAVSARVRFWARGRIEPCVECASKDL